jgi:hypothetical protein
MTSLQNAWEEVDPPLSAEFMSAEFLSAQPTNLFDAQSIMMPDFDKSFDPTMAMHTFDASRIMSADFDAWPQNSEQDLQRTLP